MNDDENVVVFCHPFDATYIMDKADDIKAIAPHMVVSMIIPKGEVTVVPEAEFLEWLKGKKE